MAMIIHKLLDGVYAKFTATGALTTAFPGGMFREEAKPGATFDFIVMELMQSAPLTDSYGNVTSADATIILKAVCKGDAAGVSGHDSGATKAAAICAAYDNVLLTLTGATTIDAYRIGEPIPIRLEDDKGIDVWQWAVTYHYSIQ